MFLYHLFIYFITKNKKGFPILRQVIMWRTRSATAPIVSLF